MYLLVCDDESENLKASNSSESGLYSTNAQTKAGSSLDRADKDGQSSGLRVK